MSKGLLRHLRTAAGVAPFSGASPIEAMLKVPVPINQNDEIWGKTLTGRTRIA
jgi:hypothetical protein